MKFYVAAPLFTDAERAFNLILAGALEAEGHAVYLPQRDTSPADGIGRTLGIFQANISALSKADAVVAICDGSQVDDGTAWEIGYAYGRNIQIFGLRTDVRIVQQSDERINLMVLESLSELAIPFVWINLRSKLRQTSRAICSRLAEGGSVASRNQRSDDIRRNAQPFAGTGVSKTEEGVRATVR